MIIFQRRRLARQSTICLLFGTGLIGSAVARHLLRRNFESVLELATSWSDQDQRRVQFARFSEFARSLAGESGLSVQIAWCAGKGRLASSEAELADEVMAFDDTLSVVEELAGEFPLGIQFTSSAGGLYEGHHLVKANTLPTPGSAYGRMKLKQEDALSSAAARLGVGLIIHRPSTVYGSHDYHRRSGLVSHLFWNALHHVPTVIEGAGHSLRDYVWADDVGAFMARCIDRFEAGEVRTHHLVSAKPSSILEVVHRVERLMGRSIGCQFRQDAGNTADITFHHGLLPQSWTPTPLEIGLDAVLRETRQSFLLESAL